MSQATSFLREIAYYSNWVYKETQFDYYDKKSDVQGKKVKLFNGYGIIFAGSNSIKDWITNFKVGNKKEGKIGVHKGYNDAFKKIRKQVDRDFRNEDEVLIAGHSSGGAMAMLASLHLAHRGKIVTCVTFGSPKVGSDEFAQLCDNSFRVVRIANKYDLIPYLPLFGFEHGASKEELSFIWRSHHMKQYLRNL